MDPAPGAAAGAASPDRTDDSLRVGKFQLRARLGSGATGTVFRALDTFSGLEVALKVLDPKILASAGADGALRRHFMTEASLAGQLSHPHIAAIYEASIDEKSGYIAVEYVPGGTLARLTRPENLLPPEEVIEIGYKCCGALDYAFRKGIIHRDIKPANLMRGEGTSLKIVDFGAALLRDAQGPAVRGVGTPSYMSPEQARGDPLSFHSDMFSFGIVLYELFTGARPFPGGGPREIMTRIVETDPPPPRQQRAGLSRDVDRIVMRMLQKSPQERFPSWADLALDLAEIGRLSVFARDVPESEKFVSLRQFKLLERLDDADIWELARASQWERVPARTTLLTEGEHSNQLYFLARGELKVTKQGRLLNLLRSGEYFGEMAYVKDGTVPRQATVETIADCLIAQFRPEAMGHLSQHCQLQLSLSLLQTVVDRLAFADERIAHA